MSERGGGGGGEGEEVIDVDRQTDRQTIGSPFSLRVKEEKCLS